MNQSPDELADLQFVPLDGTHDRAGFDCGEPSLNEYLGRYARQNAKHDYGFTFVGVMPHQPARIWAYYTLAASKVAREKWPREAKAPPFDAPTLLLARLAVAREAQGSGVGTAAMVSVFEVVVTFARVAGIFALEVDALHEQAARYYSQKWDFTAFLDEPLHLYLPTSHIRAFLQALSSSR